VNDIFPFGFALPTALYLSCYVLTLCIHLVLISYTLAGAGYLALLGVVGRQRFQAAGELGSIIQDWLPFSLGLAITAGVAPLLFLQILYQPLFYTANLLLFHRWMLIVPTLIFGFYLLYVLKSELGAKRERLWSFSAGAAFLCFAFVGWAWTENHLLSRSSDQWVEFYRSKQFFFRSAETLPRLTFWFLLAGTVTAVLLGWQLRYTRTKAAIQHQRLVCSFGIAATLLAFACLLVYASTSATELYGVVSTRLAAPYAVLALFGVLTMLGGWVVQLRHATSHWPSLVATTLGMLLVIVGVTVVREVQRLRAVDMSAFTAAHEQALKSGGLWAFLVFLTVNSLLVVFALRVAHEAIARGTE
jgi:hypothetical protein